MSRFSGFRTAEQKAADSVCARFIRRNLSNKFFRSLYEKLSNKLSAHSNWSIYFNAPTESLPINKMSNSRLQSSGFSPAGAIFTILGINLARGFAKSNWAFITSWIFLYAHGTSSNPAEINSTPCLRK